jgi:hypothetical protein
MRKFGGVRAGFSPYLSYMLLRIRTRPEVLIRIVAPKGAGSSPVGHPLQFGIGKPKMRKLKEAWSKHRGLLTPLWHHSGEVREV